MNLKIRPLTQAIGAEVLDFDARNIAPEAARALDEAFLEHHVLVLRDQQIDDADLVGFGRCFGEVKKSRLVSKLSGRDDVMVISNIREDGKPLGQLPDGEMWFHIDQIYQPLPCKAAALHAVELPATGGDTLFSNNVHAYETLPEATRARIENLMATHSFQYGETIGGAPRDENRPHHTHPLVRRIPETGRRSLSVCRLMTDRIEGLDDDESRALIGELCDHIEHPSNVYVHTWRIGDILIWDNRCTSHARTDFSETERRLLKRVTIADTISPQH
jgi:taurine dioxygenase